MRRTTALLLPILLLAAACQAPAPPPAAPSAPPGAPAAAGPSTSAADGWEQIVAAARREGRVIVTGPITAETQEAMTRGFEAKYPEIKVQYTGSSGAAVTPKILGEREAGLHNWDLVVNGTSTHFDLARAGALDPMQLSLVGPNTREVGKWLGGSYDFADHAGQYSLVMTSIAAPTLTYSPAHVNPAEVRSYYDLLDPKWRGKLAILDPRSGGSGQAMVSYLYATDRLGKEFVRQLFAQNVTISRDERQLTDWVARGQYLLQLCGSVPVVTELRGRGINIDMRGAEHMAEGGWLTAGPGAVAMVNAAPHPNAAKVYLDYLLSAEGQASFSKAIGYASRRQDVPSDHVPGYFVPKAGIDYQLNYKEIYSELRDELVEFLRSILGS
jgi:iron(III) transport system substrate-binding protein